MDQRGMVLLAGNSHPALAELIAKHLEINVGSSLVYYNTTREIQVEIQESVRGKDVYILQTGAKDVNNSIFELLMMADACKRISCKNIIGVLPYLPYSHQTKMRRRGNISLKLVAEMICKAGLSHVITLDLHSKESQGFFSCRMDNLRASPFFLQYIVDSVPNYNNAVIVAKNPMAARRATSYAERLRLGFAVIHGVLQEHDNENDARADEWAIQDGRGSPPPASPADKEPSATKSRMFTMGVGPMLPNAPPKEKPPASVVGDVSGRIAIIVDDMIDDVKSFIDAATLLKENGAVKVYAMATHGIFTTDAARMLNASQLDEIVVTNSNPHETQKAESTRINTVDISILLAEAIRRIHNNESMSHLFKNVTMED